MGNPRQNGTAIRTFRVLRCMSRDELVEKLQTISYPYLANIENEHKSATPEVLHKIAKALDVPVASIVREPLFATEAAS